MAPCPWPAPASQSPAVSFIVKVNVTSLETSRFLQSQSEGCGRRGAGDQGRGCSERTRITSAACPMGDLDHRRVQQLAQRLSGQNRCARSFKPAPRCHLATRDRCACSSRSQGQADHREGGQMRCSQRAAHQELAAALRAAGLCQSAAAGVLRCSTGM